MASSMSSFSSSSPSSHYLPKKYDVFISFRGEDTRFNFTSHLHEALCRNKIETFIDYDLERGDKVWGSLEKAIEDSTLFLIVFSENYAYSTWCLMELTKILECAKGDEGVVFPIFYRIEPSHVRKQLGSCEIAMAKHEKNGIHKEHVHQWRKALTEAANLAGWDSNVHRNEAKLIEEIVQCIIKKLSSMSQSFYMDGLVGIDDQISHLESLICKGSQDVRFIGIWGIGGIGKTTIATVLFNKLCSTFESFCFLSNVREESEKYGMSHLENKLISILLEGKESNMGMYGGAYTFVHRRLGRKKVLVVLDDVSDSEQLRYLAERPNWFGQGSRIIITTRDKQLLSKNIDDDDIYEVQPMEFHEALKLFNLNALKNDCPTNMEFQKLSHEVVSYAKGIPLAIVVLGGILCGKGEKEWRSQLEKLKKMSCPKIHQILKLSYEGLDYEEKNIFLDVACFFKGRMVEKVENLLDACGYSTTIGLRRLQDKALLTISNEIVSMHDLIQQMGREIVREESFEDPGKRSRLWNPNDIYQVLKENKGSGAIRGISLDVSKIEDLILNPQVFAKMSNLKFLEIHDSNSNGHSLLLPQGLKSLSNELRYLRWDKWPLKSLPLAFSAESLVELQMQDSGIRKLWHGIQNVVNLKAIDLCHSTHLIELPDFSKAFNLEKAHLNNWSSLRKVHQSILSLQKLQVLELEQCVSLTSLTSDSQLTSLHHLSLSGCSRLKEFSIPSQNLRFLNLFKTTINEWPSSMGPLFKLEHLDLRWCKGLKNLPSNFFNGLHSLQELWLDGCSNMIELPQNMIDLCSLRQLSIAGIAIQRLPESMKHLSSLSYFELRDCKRLQFLPELPPFVELIDASDCSSLKTVVTSSDAENESSGDVKYTRFQNCMNLDEDSVKAILGNVMTHIRKSVSGLMENFNGEYDQTEVVYPGNRVPKWFKYKTTQASITVDLSSAPDSIDWGLVFCVVASPSQSIRCEGYFKINGESSDDDDDDGNDKDGSTFYHIDASKLESDHVSLWYNAGFCSMLHQRIKERRGNNGKLKILCKMNVFVWDKDRRKWERQRDHCKEIRECGVCPTYVSEYQSFIEEIKNGAGYRCSYDKEEDGFVFPRFPATNTWKKGTQGLKDLVFLKET